ncbi:hypothetical protein D3C87_22830 [compost metagenome]
MYKKRVKRKAVTKRKTAAKRGVAKKVNKPRYKVGEFVYSKLNPTEKRQINEVKQFKTPGVKPKYRLILCDPKGHPKRSGWIEESTLSRRKKR